MRSSMEFGVDRIAVLCFGHCYSPQSAPHPPLHCGLRFVLPSSR